MPVQQIALSIKQPWATLVVHGKKQLEIRRWSTSQRGRVLIHTGKVADSRDAAWVHVPKELHDFTELRGGIIGAVDVVGCQTYRSLEEFVKDRAQHLNEPEWFEKPALYGFRLANPEVLPFRSYPGWVRFFKVES